MRRGVPRRRPRASAGGEGRATRPPGWCACSRGLTLAPPPRDPTTPSRPAWPRRHPPPPSIAAPSRQRLARPPAGGATHASPSALCPHMSSSRRSPARRSKTSIRTRPLVRTLGPCAHGRPAAESAPPPRLTPRRLILMAGELGRLLGQIWGELSDREKKPFQVLADQDKRRAERELAAYNATTDNLHSAA